MAEDEIIGWFQQLNKYEFEQGPGDGEGQGSLACWSPWDNKESDTTEQLNNNNKLYHSNMNFQMFKLVLEKAEEPEIKLPTCAGSSKEQESSRKAYISTLLTMPTPLTVWITVNCGQFFKRWENQTT